MTKPQKVKLTKAGRTRGADYVDRAPVPRAARRQMGRPTAYEDAVTLASACFLAKRGATDQEIAEELGINVGTLYRWYGEHPDFRDAVTRAKSAVDERVARSLFSRATGFHYTEQKLHQGNIVELRSYLPADPGAAMNWLKNRDRANWRDTREIDLVVPVDDNNREELDNRSLALAAINLLTDASTEDVGRTTLDLEPNSTEEDAFDDDDREQAAETEDGEAEAPDEDFDPDFDR